MEIKELMTDTEIQECLELVEDTVTNKDVTNHPELGEDKETDLVLPEDKEIICKSSGRHFVFSIGEQEFYKSKNFPTPKHCHSCAKKRRRKFLNYK